MDERDLLPQVDEWISAMPTGLLVEQIATLRLRAAEYKARAEQLEAILQRLDSVRLLKTWACKVEGCEERAYVNRGPYARLCGAHRIEEEIRRTREGGLPGRPSHRRRAVTKSIRTEEGSK